MKIEQAPGSAEMTPLQNLPRGTYLIRRERDETLALAVVLRDYGGHQYAHSDPNRPVIIGDNGVYRVSSNAKYTILGRVTGLSVSVGPVPERS